MDADLQEIEVNINNIVSLQPIISQLSKCFTDDLDEHYAIENGSEASEHWKSSTYHHALIRLNILIEDNFNVMETLGLVSATRYIFELTLWLRLFELDVRYALVYHRRLIDNGRQHYEDTLKQHILEVDLLRRFENEECQKTSEASEEVRSTPGITPDQATAIFLQARNETDAKAARLFSIYADEAKSNGYGVQAAFLEASVIPNIRNGIQAHKRRLESFDEKFAKEIHGLIGCSNWNKMASEVGMTDEYDYIYSSTSKLLHCSPASITTNQKRLEYRETAIFLRYIHTTIRDIVDLAVKQPECKLGVV